MTNEIEKTIETLLNKKSTSNLEKYKSILNTESGQKIFSLLMKDGGVQMKDAISKAKSGNYDLLKEIINDAVSTKEGAEVAQKIMEVSKNE